MARRAPQAPSSPQPKVFDSIEEIDRSITKLERRLSDLESIDLRACVHDETKADVAFMTELKSTLSDIFGVNSPEAGDVSRHFYFATHVDMTKDDRVRGREGARSGYRTKLQSLIKRLQEYRIDLVGGATPTPASYFDTLNLHPRIADVARDLFLDGHHWPAVFEASKALFNYVKERSGAHQLDGVPLMATAFSKNKPLLAFNELTNKTDQDEQEGMMYLFMGAALAIRNPGGHSFPEGSEQRAIEYISLLSMLAYRVQEAKRVRQQ